MLVACRDNTHEAKTSCWAFTGSTGDDGIWAKLKAAGRVILGYFVEIVLCLVPKQGGSIHFWHIFGLFLCAVAIPFLSIETF